MTYYFFLLSIACKGSCELKYLKSFTEDKFNIFKSNICRYTTVSPYLHIYLYVHYR